MKKHTIYLLNIFLILVLASLACGISGAEVDPQVVSPDEEVIPDAAAEGGNGSGLTPGWYIYSNANYVNGLALHENTLWAATLGGVVAWDLTTGQATKYTTLDGMGYLGSYDVVACAIPDLRIVVATEKGLNFFDPATGTWDSAQITPAESNVGSNKIEKIFCDQAHNRLLIGYAGLGIYDYSTGSWQQLTESDGLAWNSIAALGIVGDEIWVAGYKGISAISAQGIMLYNTENDLPDQDIKSLVVGKDGAVWVGTSSGLIRYQNGEWTLFNRDNVSNFPAYSIVGLDIAPDGTLWVSSVLEEICQFDPVSQSCLQTFQQNLQTRVKDLLVGPAGEVYYATYDHGIQVFRDGKWQPLYLENDQLASNFVEDITQDQAGNLWISTDLGANRLDVAQVDETWEIIKAGEGGPPSNWFQGIFPDASGGLWFAHDSQRASFFDGSAWQAYASDQGLQGSIYAIASSNGVTWFGSSEGLIVMEGGSTTILTDANGLPSKTVRSLLLDGDTLWVGTTDGLARLQSGQLEVALGPGAPGLPDDNIGVIVKHPDGSLLLGTPEGLARYDGTQAVTLLEPESLTTAFFGMSTQTVSDIAVDPAGTIWAATYVGLYYGDGQNWQRFSTLDGLPTNNLNTVHVDQLGTIWVGGGYTDGGGAIARYIPGEAPSTNAPKPEFQADQPPAAPETGGAAGEVRYEKNTGLPMLPDTEVAYSEEGLLNCWSSSSRETVRDFYLRELPLAGWLLDIDENGNCRDKDRCMGWHGGYDAPDNPNWFFIQGDHAYMTMNLISEGGRTNIIFSIDFEHE